MQPDGRWAETAGGAPADGTILTIMRDWADCVHRRWPACSGFAELLCGSLEDAKVSLQGTPRQLKVLAKAKVVDAGAQGFVYILEGITRLLESGEAERTETDGEDIPIRTMPADIEDDTTFRYCTECVVAGADLAVKALGLMAASFGNSLVVAGNKTKVRI